MVAVFLCVLPFSLFAWSEQHISSGMASILNATTPLMTLLVAFAAQSVESRSHDRMVGLVLGFVGVVVLIAPWTGLGNFDLLGQVVCLGATLSYGIAFNYLRRFVIPLGLSSVTIATMHVGIGAIIMIVISPAFVDSPPSFSWALVASMVALGVAGTGFAYIWNANIVSAWGATNASTATYVSPVVGVILGIVLLDERLSWNHPIGAIVVFVGIACSQGRFRGLRQRWKPSRVNGYQGDYQI